MGLEAVRLLINEIEQKTKKGLSKVFIEEEFLWRKSIKRKVKK
jgi:DNA-binding LacI/PurR family transcriptional regulator